MGFLDKYIRFRKRKARFRRPVEVILYLLVALASLDFILDFPAAHLEIYESFGLTPSPGAVYLSTALRRGWPVFLLIETGLFVYFVLYRKKSWPILFLLCFVFAIYIYFFFSFPAIKLGLFE
jgi:hypothetical protein